MRTKAILTLLGGVLIHLTLGTLYTASNLATYTISYLHVVKGMKSIDSSLAPWIFAIQSVGQALCVAVGGTIQRILGVKPAMIIGCLLVSGSTLCGYWTINNYWALCATYGLLFGVGVGVAYSSPMTAAMKWMPKNRGLANGFIVFGFGFGSFIFNYVQTWIINPENIQQVVDPTGATKDLYFPASVVQHMPKVFLILASCYLAMQAIGILLISEPNEQEAKEIAEDGSDPLIEHHDKPVSEGFSTRDTLKKGKFWQIWMTMLCVSMVNVFVSSFYKNDKIGYKKTMGIMLSLFTCFIGTFAFSQYGGKWMFMIWVCCLYFCIGGAFALIPTYTDRCFGPKYFGSNYGMVFTSVVISSVVGAFFVSLLVKKIGVMGISISLAIVVFGGVLITLIPKNWTYLDDEPTVESTEKLVV